MSIASELDANATEAFARKYAIGLAGRYNEFQAAHAAGDLETCDRIAAEVGHPYKPPLAAGESPVERFMSAIQPLTDAELLASRDPHPHAFQDGECGLFPVGEVSVLAAPGREGKTFASVALAVSYVLETTVVGLRAQPDRSVLIYSMEDDRRQYARKIEARRAHLGAEDAEKVRDRIIPVDLQTDGMEQFQAIVTVAERKPIETGAASAVIESLRVGMNDQHPLGVLIFETASTLNDADEDNPTFKVMIRALRRIARELQIAVVLVHHTSQAASNNLADLNVSVADIRGGTALVYNSRQNLILVNLGSEADPFPDNDSRTILRSLVAPDATGRISALITLDSSKSIDPPPVFFAWEQTDCGAAVSVMPTPIDYRGLSWRRLRQKLQGQRADLKRAAKDEASAVKVDEVVSIVTQLDAEGAHPTVRAVSIRAGRSQTWAAPYLDRAVDEGLLTRSKVKVPRTREPTDVYRPVSPL